MPHEEAVSAEVGHEKRQVNCQ